MRLLYLALIFLIASCRAKETIIPGTSLELAQSRKANIQKIEYDLQFNIPISRKDSIHAHSIIHFETSAAQQVQLDFAPPASQLKKIKVNSSPVAIHYENEHILIEAQKGINQIEIEFIAGEAALNRHDDYLYTLFVPARTATCFPVFDQPDLKAIYRLELNIPATWESVSQGKAVEVEQMGERKRVKFNGTKPTSTYQFAFATGHFKKAIDSLSGMTMYYRETDSLKVYRNVARIFDLHRESLQWLEDYTGIAYPYEKFDFVLMPAFQFGGMEHPGNIFYRESSLLLDPSSSVNDELRRASLIAHETAHMWFGNLVTMKWFNDVWLKEVFANFMAAKIVNPAFPEVNHELRFLMSHYPGAYDVDRTQGTHPIQQPLDNLKRAGSVYGAIIYQKAPIMMRNLETITGEASFRKGIRDYLKKFSYENATWDDLVSTLAGYTDRDLAIWNTSWIKQGGRPEMMIGPTRQDIYLSNGSAEKVWPQNILYQIRESEKTRIEKIVTDSLTSFQIKDTVGAVIIPNYGGRGYGYFSTDNRSIEFMLQNVQTFPEPQVRAGIWMNAWEYMLRGNLKPEMLLNHLSDALSHEDNPLLLEYLTDKVIRTYWQFISQAQRDLSTDHLADLLLLQLQKDKDISRKRTLFQGYREVALTSRHLLNLRKFWKLQDAEGLPLAERDRIQIAYVLALRGQEDVLKEQLKLVTNPDKQKEIMFIMPALSNDAHERDQFFENLKLPENRSQEPWVLEGLRYLHHPLRADDSKKYVPASLELLEEIRNTGDIFFPKGWLDATLGSYQSKEVAEAVRSYLQSHPNLAPDLKNKLLQSADMVFRASEIQGKAVE